MVVESRARPAPHPQAGHPCPGCGAVIPDPPGVNRPSEGASPGCWAAYGDLVARDPVKPGNSDLCLEWPGPAEAAVEHLRGHGVAVEAGPLERPGARGRGTSVYFRDPDGNRVELQVDNFATAEQANDFMREHYAENPIGILFDPEELIARYEAGEPLEALRQRPKLPPGKTPLDMMRD